MFNFLFLFFFFLVLDDSLIADIRPDEDLQGADQVDSLHRFKAAVKV